jgi:hypothetical protein
MLLSGIDPHKRDLVIGTVDSTGTVIDPRRMLTHAKRLKAISEAKVKTGAADQGSGAHAPARASPDRGSPAPAVDPEAGIDQGLYDLPRDRQHRALRRCAQRPLVRSPGARLRQLRRQDAPQVEQGGRSLPEAGFQPRGRAGDPVLPRDQELLPETAASKGEGDRPGMVARELGRIVCFVLQSGEPYDGTFKGKTLTKSKQPEWPRRTSPDA